MSYACMSMQERILELRFDNVVRVNVAGPEHVKGKTRKEVELVDSKSKEGLADEYAKEYHKAVAGVTEDRHVKTRAVCFNCTCSSHS
jgi:U3 small nucleolar ribonucleoprotein component